MVGVSELREVGDVLGQSVRVERTLPARAGTVAVVSTEGGSHRCLLKYTRAVDDQPVDRRAEGIENEARVLREHSGLFPRRLVAFRADDGRAWSLQRWIDGRDALDALGIPGGGRRRRSFATDLAAIAEVLAALHDVEIIHGDLQPAHLLRDRTGRWHAVDLESAAWPGARHGYRGGVFTFQPPEVAAARLEREDDLPVSAATDVYALGGIIYLLLTRQPLIDYGDGAFVDKLRATAAAQRRPLNRADDVLALVDDLTAPDPEARPTMREVAERLSDL